MGVRFERMRVNGDRRFGCAAPDGAILSVLVVHFDAGAAQTVANQLNPEKLVHLGPVGDFYALMGASDAEA